ncbi:alpha/beta hydrolase [Dactylosporangium salmoneum]|uniref:Alpha/beta hydrolase n=1 Tax=Dactylosporangium salmoneum TaxID=53361 RepID=A0ABN3HL85_9ACTN
MTIFADAAIERFVLDSRVAGPPLSVAQLRQGSRDRAHLRPKGPAMPARDEVAGGVAVRVFEQESKTRLVYLHGGGFVLGGLDTHDALCRRIAAATRTTVVAVDYRLAPEHPYPAAVDDALAVIDWAAGLGPVAVGGDSAGAFVAVLAARRSPAPLTAQILLCPLLDVTFDQPSAEEFGSGFTLDMPAHRDWVAAWAGEAHAVPNPLLFDLDGMPPALIVAAELDPLRDSATRYAARLADHGIDATYRVEPGMVHNFSTIVHLSAAAAAADARFLTDTVALIR